MLSERNGLVVVRHVFGRPVFARARRLGLAFPEVSEVSSWDHPNVRAGKKTFCTFEMVSNRPSIAFRLSPADVDLVLRRKHVFVTPYGRGIWVSVWVGLHHRLEVHCVATRPQLPARGEQANAHSPWFRGVTERSA